MISGSRHAMDCQCYGGLLPHLSSRLVNAGIDPSPYDNSEYGMIDRLVDLIQEKRWYPDNISVNPIDDPITCEPVFVLTRIAVRMPESDEDLELKKELLESSGFKDDYYDYDYQQHPAPFRI